MIYFEIFFGSSPERVAFTPIFDSMYLAAAGWRCEVEVAGAGCGGDRDAATSRRPTCRRRGALREGVALTVGGLLSAVVQCSV